MTDSPARDRGWTRSDRLRLIMLMEGMALHPFRAWEELPAIFEHHDIVLLPGTVFAPGEHARQWDDLQIPSFSLGCRGAWHYPRGAMRLAAISRAYDADVVQGTGPIAGFVVGLARRLGGRGLSVFHRQGDAFPGNRPLTQLTRWSGRLSELTLACSHSTARYAHEADRVPLSKIRVAHNAANRLRPVSPSEIADTRTALGVPPDAAVVAVVARLRPEKGILTLFAALEEIRARIARPLAVTIAGDGQQNEELRAAAPVLDGVRIHFVGYQDDVALWFAIGDVIAMPSSREPFGMAAVEAMVCERPIVAGRVGGLCEVVEDGVSGRLVSPRDPHALAAAIGDVLTAPERAADLARAGRERALTRFTNEAMVKAWRRGWEDFLP